MNNQDTSNWPGWISALGAAAGVVVMFLKSFFVTHAQMRQYFLDRDEERLRMHEENQENWRALATDVAEVKSALSRLEGQLSGRYPRMER
jgi:hypothetical protein